MPKTPDALADFYSVDPPKLNIQSFACGEGRQNESFMLIEGNEQALRMLGEMLIAASQQSEGFDFSLHPEAAGQIFFASKSTHGIYIHRVS
jgi:hypothetical protein